MIRLRKADGSAQAIPDGVFVELVNDVDQSVGTVFFQPIPGVINQINPGTRDAQRYEQMFSSQNIQFTPQLIARDMRG